MRTSFLSGLAGRCFGLPTLAIVVAVGNAAFRGGEAETGSEVETPLAADPEHREGCPTCQLIRAMDDRALRRTGRVGHAGGAPSE